MKHLTSLLIALLLALLPVCALAEAVSSDQVEEFDPAAGDVPYEYTVDQETLAAETAETEAPAQKAGLPGYAYALIGASVVVIAVIAVAAANSGKKKPARKKGRR